ncbi:UNVERIFIED_CONTAM: hypothetical protein FKN15_039590 [Acipenser sinensis]
MYCFVFVKNATTSPGKKFNLSHLPKRRKRFHGASPVPSPGTPPCTATLRHPFSHLPKRGRKGRPIIPGGVMEKPRCLQHHWEKPRCLQHHWEKPHVGAECPEPKRGEGEPHQSPATEGDYPLLPPPPPEGDYPLLLPPPPEGDYPLLPPPPE